MIMYNLLGFPCVTDRDTLFKVRISSGYEQNVSGPVHNFWS
jgi:hypothetical protein